MGNKESSRIRAAVSAGSVLLLLSLLAAAPAAAADTWSATKTRNPDGTYSTSQSPGAIAIPAPGQLVHWEANYFGSGTEGNDFYLNTEPSNLTAIVVSTSLASGMNTGTLWLGPGNYFISINYFGMGPGNYTITYNQTAQMGLSPTNHLFGQVLEDESSAPFTFTLENTGDLPLTVGPITNTDAAHFEVQNDPTGASLSPTGTRTFRVAFHAGAASGTMPAEHSATITIGASSGGGPSVTPVTITVSGTTMPKLPDIDCCGGGTVSLGTADQVTGVPRTFTHCFRNVGTRDLVLTAVTLVNDDPLAPFSLVSAVNLAPIPPAGSRSASIRFTPPAAGGERDYTGYLRVDSNDPDEPVATCRFRATAHHPVPRMQVSPGVLDYREVELGFAYSKPLVVSNAGDADLVLTVAMNVAFPIADAGQWSTVGIGAQTITAGHETSFVSTYEPHALGSHSLHLLVSGNDPAHPTQDVPLQATAIAPVPVDSVLLLDRSGSMAENAGDRRKIDALQASADLFVHLLRAETGSGTGDGAGIAKYNHTNAVYVPFGLMTPAQLAGMEGALSDAAVSDTARLGPDGTTSIGGGLQTAASMLSGRPVDRKHVLVLVSDGLENTPPWVNDVLPGIEAVDPTLRIYSVGVGDAFSPAVLQAVSNVTNGYWQASDDLSGLTRFDLESFYFKTLSNATGMSIVVDPTHTVVLDSPFPQEVDRATICSSDRVAVFVVFEVPGLRPYYDLQVIDPHGQVMEMGASVGGIPIHTLTRMDYRIVKVVFPDRSQAHTYVGEWIVRLTPNGRWNKAEVKRAMRLEDNGKTWEALMHGTALIGFGAAVRSDYRMEVQVIADSTLPGASVRLAATLTDRFLPAPRGSVSVTGTLPDGAEHVVTLVDDGTHGDAIAGDAVFTAPFAYTAQSGTYRFLFHATAVNDRREPVMREDARSLFLGAAPSESGRPCISCRWLRFFILLAILLLLALLCILIRCCRGRFRTVAGR